MLHMLLAATLTMPKYFAVHIDQPRDRAALEDADRRDAAARKEFYDAHKLERPRVIMFSSGDGTLYTLRRRESFADFDKPSALSDDLRKELNAKTEASSNDAHKSLRAHHNEIWEVDTDTTLLRDTAAPPFARLITDTVKPSMTEQYSDVMTKVHDAVAKMPNVSLVAFFSGYGDGAYRYLVLADQPVDLFARVPPEVLKQWRACVEDSRVIDVRPRPELSATDPAHWLD